MVYRHYFHCLNQPQQQLYRLLHQALLRSEAAIPCGSWPPEQISTVIHALLLDSPELCHFEGKWAWQGAVLPRYTLPAHSCPAVEQAAAGLLPVLGESGEALPREAYRWLLENVRYDLTAPRSQTAWGVLIDRAAVCKGIAKAYQLVLRQGGIPCILAEGSLDGQAKHVWNLVRGDRGWFHVDVTMGYPQFRHLVSGADFWCGFGFSPDIAAHTVANPQLLPKEVFGNDQ